MAARSYLTMRSIGGAIAIILIIAYVVMAPPQAVSSRSGVPTGVISSTAKDDVGNRISRYYDKEPGLCAGSTMATARLVFRAYLSKTLCWINNKNCKKEKRNDIHLVNISGNLWRNRWIR